MHQGVDCGNQEMWVSENWMIPSRHQISIPKGSSMTTGWQLEKPPWLNLQIDWHGNWYIFFYPLVMSNSLLLIYWLNTPFLVGLPIQNGWMFYSYVNVYQRIIQQWWVYPTARVWPSPQGFRQKIWRHPPAGFWQWIAMGQNIGSLVPLLYYSILLYIISTI